MHAPVLHMGPASGTPPRLFDGRPRLVLWGSPQYFRNHIPGAAQKNLRAQADALALDIVPVVQGGVADGSPAQFHRFQISPGRELTRTANLPGYFLDYRSGFLRGKFESNGPAGETIRAAQGISCSKASNLHHHAVDEKIQLPPLRFSGFNGIIYGSNVVIITHVIAHGEFLNP
ncbi:hypothetical protein SDC9_98746 [bioreactor metagenome]|uniref:Uncharacterized protein n=1 Tax=bioreactor metagenome TaxID=1076179 RepID=A0A645AMD9_9ZZZZ